MTVTSTTTAYPDQMTAEWAMSDAWVFSAIEGTSRADGYRLAQLIAKADGINHALLLEAELVRAVPRLEGAGLIGADPMADRYWHTERGRSLYQAAMKRRGLFGWIEGVPPALGRLGSPRDAEWSLPEQAFNLAVAQYVRRQVVRGEFPTSRPEAP
jgi:hypothetical protein